MKPVSLAEAHANTDVLRGLGLWRLWVFLSWQDIKQRYRGSVLGPFWVSGSLAAISLGAGILYARILHVPYQEYIPFLVLGLTVWTMISGAVLEGTGAFLSAANLIKNSSLPISMQIYRTLSRNAIVMAHNTLVVALVFLFLKRPPSPAFLLVLPGLALLLLNLTWMTWVAAALSARYRDIAQIIAYVMQFLLFMTPVFWMAHMVGRSSPLLVLNPLWHLIEIVRAPVFGGPINPLNWWVSAVMAVVGLTGVYFAQRRYRNQVIHWV